MQNLNVFSFETFYLSKKLLPAADVPRKEGPEDFEDRQEVTSNCGRSGLEEEVATFCRTTSIESCATSYHCE